MNAYPHSNRIDPPFVLRNLPNGQSRGSVLALVVLVFVLLFSACEDRLPTNWNPPDETVSDNAFILEGNGYRHRVYNLPMKSARIHYFPDDGYSSIWNADSLFDADGKKVYVTMQITFPGDRAGAFAWEDPFLDGSARTTVRIGVDKEEWVSTTIGSTTVEIDGTGAALRIHGWFEGLLQNARGDHVIVSHGAFNGPLF
jgi:hypothetical protein